MYVVHIIKTVIVPSSLKMEIKKEKIIIEK